MIYNENPSDSFRDCQTTHVQRYQMPGCVARESSGVRQESTTLG